MKTTPSSAASPIAFIQQAQEGVDFAQINQFMQTSGLQKAALAELLGLDPKTLDNYRRQGKSLDKLRSELLLKLFEVFCLGKEVLGTMDNFRAWLYLPAGEFGGAKPWQLLSTVTGVGEVYDQLQRIAHGYVV